MRSLCKTTAEYRIDTIDEVKSFQEKMREEAAQKNYQLSSYSWTEKQVKAKGEIIDEYYLVKAILVINDAKDPELAISDFTLDFKDIF